jgi:DNA-directed RNA polymerase omega subunit
LKGAAVIKDQPILIHKEPVAAHSLELLLSKAGGSVFRLARCAMLRALSIHFGAAPLVDHFAGEKETTISLREIGQGKVIIKDINP